MGSRRFPPICGLLSVHGRAGARAGKEKGGCCGGPGVATGECGLEDLLLGTLLPRTYSLNNRPVFVIPKSDPSQLVAILRLSSLFLVSSCRVSQIRVRAVRIAARRFLVAPFSRRYVVTLFVSPPVFALFHDTLLLNFSRYVLAQSLFPIIPLSTPPPLRRHHDRPPLVVPDQRPLSGPAKTIDARLRPSSLLKFCRTN